LILHIVHHATHHVVVMVVMPSHSHAAMHAATVHSAVHATMHPAVHAHAVVHSLGLSAADAGECQGRKRCQRYRKFLHGIPSVKDDCSSQKRTDGMTFRSGRNTRVL
jgi:hypothetical protein